MLHLFWLKTVLCDKFPQLDSKYQWDGYVFAVLLKTNDFQQLP